MQNPEDTVVQRHETSNLDEHTIDFQSISPLTSAPLSPSS